MVRETSYDLLPAQTKFLVINPPKFKDKNKIYHDISVYYGGVGSGKTWCGSLRGLTYALQWAGCRGLVGAVSQDLLDNTTKRKYLEHMENMGLVEGEHWWFEDRQQQIHFKNGSVIRFKTLSDWRQFMSEEFTWIEFEEASFLDRIVFEKLITRLRQMKRQEWKGYYRSLFMHTNPQGKRGWINEFFCNESTKKKGYRFIRASTRENIHLGSEYVETLENLYSADQIKEMVEGFDVDNDNTVAFPDFDMDENVRDDVKFDPNYPLVLGCDFNYNPMCWYLMQERENKWYILQELIHNNVTTKQMCERVLPIIAGDYGVKKLLIMGDAHGNDNKTNGNDYSVMISYFQDNGLDCTLLINKSNPPIKDRLAVLRGYIRNAKGERKLFIHPSCLKLIYNYNECKNNLVNGGLRIPTDKEIQSDDSKRYLIHPIDASSYPIYYMTTMREIAGDDYTLNNF